MKKNNVLLICVVLMMAVGMSSCSSDDDVNSLLLNEWILVSYGNETNEVVKEANGYYYSITFLSDGTYSGRAYGNRMNGKYECNGQNIKFFDGMITQVYNEGSDPDKFFLEHGRDINFYTVTDKELRLYYSKDDYFKFRINSADKNNDDSNFTFDNYREDIIGTWQLVCSSGGWTPRVNYEPGEITLTFKGNGEVEVVNKRENSGTFPSGTYDYSFVTIERSIFTGEPETVMLLDLGYYSFNYEDGLLHLSEQAYDGGGFTIKKIG